MASILNKVNCNATIIYFFKYNKILIHNFVDFTFKF